VCKSARADMSRQLIVVKVVLDDGSTKTIRCEPTTTIAEIKEQFSYRYNPQDHRICFADGRVGDESMVIGAYRIEEGAVLYLRNKQLSVPHNVEPDDVRKPSWINNAGGQQLGVPSASSAPAPAHSASSSDLSARKTKMGPAEVVDVEHEADSKIRVTKLKTFLSHFLRRRPNADELIKAKIIEEAPTQELVHPSLDMVKAA